MNNRLSLLWVLCSLLTFSACKKPAVSTSPPATPKLISQVKVNNLEFKYLSAKGRLQLEEADGSKVTSGLTMRIRQDSVIWISVVPGLGIEVARLRITPDSVQMVNRLEKTYFAGNYSILRDKFKIDVDFATVQAILLGNYLPAGNHPEKILTGAPLQQIRQEKGALVIDQFLDLADFKLKKLSVKDQETNNSIVVNYTQFEPLGNYQFARGALIVVQQGGSTSNKGAIANLEYNKVDLEESPLAFPFSIPAGYTRK